MLSLKGLGVEVVTFFREPEEVDLLALLEGWKKDILFSINCHAIGQIVEFNKNRQLARVKIMYKKRYYRRDQGDEYKPVLEPYPVFINCPVIVLNGGNMSLRLPIKQGDDCLVLFNDRDIDNWLESGQESELNSSRLHDFSDAIIIVGLHPKPRPLSGYSSDRAELGTETTKVSVGSSDVMMKTPTSEIKSGPKIKIEANGVNIKSLIDGLADQVTALGGAGAAAIKVQAALILED